MPESKLRVEAARRREGEILSFHNFKSPDLKKNSIGGSWAAVQSQAEVSSDPNNGFIRHCLITPSFKPEKFIDQANERGLSAASFHFSVPDIAKNQDLVFERTILDKYVDRVLTIAKKNDMLYSHMALAGIVNLEVARERGYPHTFLPHALEIMSAENFPDRELRSLRLVAEYALAKYATHIITNTEYERRYYAEHYSKLPSDPINRAILKKTKDFKANVTDYDLDAMVFEKVGGHLPTRDEIYNKCVPNALGVDPVLFSPDRRAKLRRAHRGKFCNDLRIPSSDDTIILGCVGRYHPQKDQITGVRIFKDAYDKLPNEFKKKVYLVYAGPEADLSNPYFRDVKAAIGAYCPELEDRIFLTDRADSDVMNSILDIRIDSCRFETFGLATAEALRSGLPTVMASNPVYEEIYAEKKLKFIKLGKKREDVGEFGDALVSLIVSKDERLQYGEICHRAVEPYLWTDSVKRLNDVFKSDL